MSIFLLILYFAQANQELGNIFPVFNEISASGNALERVLALEIELAEALQAKKKSSIQFQRYTILCSNNEILNTVASLEGLRKIPIFFVHSTKM